MKTDSSFTLKFFALTAAALFAGSALADKPSWAGGGKHGKQDERYEDRDDHRRGDYRDDRRDDRRRDDYRDDRRGGSIEFRFDDGNRRIVNDYYGGQFRAGHCPPGLAKKNNGCLPPGQAKKWAMGRPLPRDVQYYDLPHDLLVRLPAPPPNHRYVRVASDILMIAVGTSMVVDSIQDIGR